MYFSTLVCWHITLTASSGLPNESGEVCINLCSSLLQIQLLKPQGDLKSSINEEPGGQQQIIGFIPENVIKGSRRGKKKNSCTFIMLSLFTVLA